VKLGPERTGAAIAEAAADLARIWRGARSDASPETFPGAIDGVVELFVRRAGDALATGGDPGDAWAQALGVVRLAAAPGEAERGIEAEWRLLGEVLAAACDTLEAAPSGADFLARAVDAARRGIGALRAGSGPPGVVVVYQRSGLRPRGASRP
jgi:hypothetical protein